ncbi:MAG: TolC family protein [Candidatus Omnitrophota bacterium]|nr:TolC family protein [Candidatus Omnitrophota bacterium]
MKIIKKIPIFIIAVILALFHVNYIYSEEAYSAAPAKAMTIKDAIVMALMDNKSIQIQEEELDYAKANIMYAKSLFLPLVTTGFGYAHTDSLLYSEPFANHRKDTRIYSGYINENLFGISAEESIYNGGANIANLEQARLGLKAQEEILRTAKLEIEFETKRLFYGLLLAYETRRIARDLVGQAEDHYEEVKEKYGQGTASKFDCLQSKVQVSRLIPQLVNADNAIDLLMAEFKQLLFLNMIDEIAISGKLKYSEIEIKEDEFLKEAYSGNPQMILKLMGIDISRWGIEFAKAGWLPQVSANASYTYRSDDLANMINPRHDNWNAGIKASIAIFDGFSTKAKVDEAKARYRQSWLQKEDLTEQLAVDVKNACLNLKEAKAIIEAERDTIIEAKEALRLSEVRFDNGVGINLDVLDSQVALAQVEQSLAQGKYDYIMAKAALDRTMGRDFAREASYYED